MNFFKKIDIYYIVTLLFLLVAATANFISSSDVWWFTILVFMFLLAIFKKLIHPKDIRLIVLFSLAYLAFVSIRDLLINGLDIEFLLSDIIFLFKYVYLAFIFCVILKEKAAAYIVNVTTHLTVLSFFFYFLQLIGLGDYIYEYSSALGLSTRMEIPGYTNFLFFTFTKGFHDYGNSGFVWEPGSFGCFLIIALMLNFFLNKFTFDKKSIILIIGIITTVATTPYLALLIVLFLAYRYKVAKINMWAVLLVLVFAAIIIATPLLGTKIKDTYYEDMDDLNRVKYLAIFYKHQNMLYIPLNRFSSMAYIYNTFSYKLIWGVSNKFDVILNKQFLINISNGVFDFLAKFGLVGLIYLVYKYAKFCIAYVLKSEYVIYCILILLVLGFGETILSLVFILMFIFLPVTQIALEKQRFNKLRPA